jgi:hypothetical protein
MPSPEMPSPEMPSPEMLSPEMMPLPLSEPMWRLPDPTDEIHPWQGLHMLEDICHFWWREDITYMPC